MELISFGLHRRLRGVTNGKIRDSPRRRECCSKIWDRNLKVLTKSEPKSPYEENRTRDFILQKSKLVLKTICSETWAMRYSKINIYKVDKSRVPKCYSMTTNLRLKNPTCRAYIFERLLLFVFNQINTLIYLGFDQNYWPKNKSSRLRDHVAKNSRIQDAKKHKKMRFRDSLKTPLRFRDWNKNFRDPEFSGYRYHSPPLLRSISWYLRFSRGSCFRDLSLFDNEFQQSSCSLGLL